MMTNSKRFYILFFSFSLLTVFSVSVFYSDFFLDDNQNEKLISAKNNRTPQNTENNQTFQNIERELSPSQYVEYLHKQNIKKPLFATPDIERAIRQARKSVWKINDYSNTGTGFFISPTLFVTNLHVVLHHFLDNRPMQEIFAHKKGYKDIRRIKNIQNLSFAHDLIIFETNQRVSHYLTLPSETPKLTNSVFIVGYPKRLFQIIKSTTLNFSVNKHTMNMYFNKSKLHGTSGSPVLNEKGELMGIHHASNYNLAHIIQFQNLKKLMKSSINQNQTIQSLLKEKMLEADDAITQFIIALTLYSKISQKSHWMKKSAEGGYLPAQLSLGDKYYKDKDYSKAFHWIKKSAEGGYAPAQFRLGRKYYYYSINLLSKNKKTFHWIKKSAEQGYVLAQYQLGKMFYYGIGTKKNYDKAYYWIKKSAEQGIVEIPNYDKF